MYKKIFMKKCTNIAKKNLSQGSIINLATTRTHCPPTGNYMKCHSRHHILSACMYIDLCEHFIHVQNFLSPDSENRAFIMENRIYRI